MFKVYEFWYSLDLQSHNGPTIYDGHALSFQFQEHAYRAAGEVALQTAIDRDLNNTRVLSSANHQITRGYFFAHNQQCPACHVGFSHPLSDVFEWIVTFYVVEGD